MAGKMTGNMWHHGSHQMKKGYFTVQPSIDYIRFKSYYFML